MACDLKGFLLCLDPAVCCLRDLGLAELRNTGSVLVLLMIPDLWQLSSSFKVGLSDPRMTE